jgi:hypothetical protein
VTLVTNGRKRSAYDAPAGRGEAIEDEIDLEEKLAVSLEWGTNIL